MIIGCKKPLGLPWLPEDEPIWGEASWRNGMVMQRKQQLALEGGDGWWESRPVRLLWNITSDSTCTSAFLFAFANFSGLQLRWAAFGARVTHEERWHSVAANLDSCRRGTYIL